jgi:hypothetical protein
MSRNFLPALCRPSVASRYHLYRYPTSSCCFSTLSRPLTTSKISYSGLAPRQSDFGGKKDRWYSQSSTNAKPSSTSPSQPASKKREEWCLALPNSTSGNQVYVIGVEYNRATNAEVVFETLNKLAQENKGLQNAVILMESYNCPCEHDIHSGQMVPYRDYLSPKAVQKAISRLKDPEFRGRLSGEVCAVFQSLGLNIDVIFCDRSHVLSVDRIVNRYGLKELETKCTEGFQATLMAAKAGKIPVVYAQNMLLPAFEELNHERHVVMAHCARIATQSRNAVVVIGGQHVAGVKEVWQILEQAAKNSSCQETTAPPASAAAKLKDLDLTEIHELLCVPPVALDPWEKQLQKRALLLALFITTSAFPPETVTASIAEVNDHDTEEVKSHYRTYRTEFQRAMQQTAVSTQDLNKVLAQGTEIQGLPQLMKLLDYYDKLVD